MSSARAGPAPRVTRRLVLVSVVAGSIAAALYLLTVGTRTGQLLSELALGGRPATIGSIVAAEGVLSTLSRASLVLGVVVMVAIALLQQRPRLAIIAVAMVVGANVTTQLLKVVVLDRSDLLDGAFYVLPNSFPSGHATAAASIAVGIVLVLPPLVRAPAIVISAVFVGVVGAATLIAGWHRMADAIGGVFVATAWGAGLAAILAWRRGVDAVGRRTEAFGRLFSTMPLLVGAALVIVGGLAYLLVAIDPLGVLSELAERGGSPAVFWVAVVITIGASSLALGALGLALRDIGLDPRVAVVTPRGGPAGGARLVPGESPPDGGAS